MRNVYACTYTGWKKVLGWDAVINKEERWVSLECPGVIDAAVDKFLKGTLLANNKHIMPPSIMHMEAIHAYDYDAELRGNHSMRPY